MKSFSYVYSVMRETLNPLTMNITALYEVLPFTFNYGEPIFHLFRVFRTQYEAYQYANEFKWVEVETIILEEVINEHLNTINPL
jgi:hypothetical protein